MRKDKVPEIEAALNYIFRHEDEDAWDPRYCPALNYHDKFITCPFCENHEE